MVRLEVLIAGVLCGVSGGITAADRGMWRRWMRRMDEEVEMRDDLLVVKVEVKVMM